MDTLTITIEGQAEPTVLDRAALEGLPESALVPDVSALVKGRDGAAIRLGALLDLAGAGERFTLVHVESRDGSFTANVAAEEARTAGLVLFRLGDNALPTRFGGPFRLLFLDAADCSVNVKDLARIDLVTEPGSHTARCADG
ncbi:MAG: hypothetical protein AAGG01_18520 [Planctomycetota bacterium]